MKISEKRKLAMEIFSHYVQIPSNHVYCWFEKGGKIYLLDEDTSDAYSKHFFLMEISHKDTKVLGVFANGDEAFECYKALKIAFVGALY